MFLLPFSLQISPRVTGFMRYIFLLVANIALPLISVITVDVVATVEILVVTCNSLAALILISTLFYKLFMRSFVFNSIKPDQPVLFFVAFLDIVAAIGWLVRLDNKGFCTNPSGGTATCHTKLFVVALLLSWISFIVAFYSGVFADHKEDPPLPVHISRPDISPPVAVTIAGEYGPRDGPKHIPIVFPSQD